MGEYISPKRTKYQYMHKGNMKGVATRGSTIAFGEFALQTKEPSRITGRQIESARIAINRYMKRGGKLWIRIFPDKPVTVKAIQSRMGSGKGAKDHYVAVVKPGKILFEIGGVSEEVAKEAMRLASYKLPITTRFLSRGETENV